MPSRVKSRYGKLKRHVRCVVAVGITASGLIFHYLCLFGFLPHSTPRQDLFSQATAREALLHGLRAIKNLPELNINWLIRNALRQQPSMAALE